MKVIRSVIALFFLAFSFSSHGEWNEEWNKTELSILNSLSLSALKPPTDPSNRYLLNKQAQALGKKIFFDTRFSQNGLSSCASCHQPEKYFTDGLPTGVGISTTNRNTPTVVGTAWHKWFYWDGRRDSLWSQALIPFEASNEMGSSRVAVVQHIAQDPHYRRAYENLFGVIPKALLSKSLPDNAGPFGDKKSQRDWYRLPADIKIKFNKTFTDIGKTIAAYESTLVPKPTKFDLYVKQLTSDTKPTVTITENERKGIKLFIDATKTQCLQCHNGPLLTNGVFHNIGTGNFSGKKLDFGRIFGLQAVLVDEFNCLGRYSDADTKDCSQLRFLNKSPHIPLRGAFKTPSLRNLSLTAPYFHDGSAATLEQVINHYNLPPSDNGAHELKALDLTKDELQSLLSFVMMLDELK